MASHTAADVDVAKALGYLQTGSRDGVEKAYRESGGVRLRVPQHVQDALTAPDHADASASQQSEASSQDEEVVLQTRERERESVCVCDGNRSKFVFSFCRLKSLANDAFPLFSFICTVQNANVS